MDKISKMRLELKIHLVKKNLTQREIAKSLGRRNSTQVCNEVNRHHINRLPKQLLPKFCKLLEIDYEAYLRGEVKEL